ncbi:hypothetical protein PtA15_2A372 [Puccinia triticina]|uniref:Brl1/Brr6 domain-containing protein n=1 Tax=Puccinia triticina TaxID=208348 RepID=A0ABY7CBM6_9BASI|nr:uncharacterized protein PtA15_2A372 [Puccinia triticina]WAQ82059.1 hypothetical protein PtA15_2A372 [Puccinia triticina]
MAHPFRPPRQPPAPSRSTETPMDFAYDKPASSASHLSASAEPPRAAIRPLKLIAQNGTAPPQQPSRQSDETLRTAARPASWFASLRARSSPEPPRKRLHCETESMDWEVSPPEPNPHPTAHPRAPAGGTFLFDIPKRLPLPAPPLYTAPAATLPSPQKIGPASFGLSPRARPSYREDPEADSSLDIDHFVPQPIRPAKMYSTNAVKHETRRRTRAHQKQIRSKLSTLSFHSDHEQEEAEDDSDVEVLSAAQTHHGLLGKPKAASARRRADRIKPGAPGPSTTNYLTINGWKGADGPQQQPPSRLSTDTPYILLVYLQLLFNSSLVFVGLYLAINLILIIRTDINHNVLVHTARLRQEIDACASDYHANRCFPATQRTPFIEKHCLQWEACMARNPSLISRAKIGAETFAEVINGFLFIFLSIGAGIYATNMAMNNYKAKWESVYNHPKPPSAWAPRLTPRKKAGADQADNQAVDPITVFARNQEK